mgnify:CR=1 FL=1|jgi:hypothetical protein
MTDHQLFILWSYLGVGVVTFGMIGLVVWDWLRVNKRLADLEKSGIRRRSAGAPTP